MRFFKGAAPETPGPAYARTAEVGPYPEIGPDYLPENVLVHFHFAPHLESGHFESIRPVFDKADIYFPEFAGWGMALRRDLLAISRGDRKRYAAHQEYLKSPSCEEPFAEFILGVVDALYRRGKFLDFVDANEAEVSQAETTLPGKDSETVEEALQAIADHCSQTIFEDGLRRDRIIARNLGPAVTRIVTNNKVLRRKDQVLVLSTLGSAHIGVYEHLVAHPLTQGQVTATQWADEKPGDGTHAVHEKYARGETPTREELLYILVNYALNLTPMPPDFDRPVLPLGATDRIHPDKADLFGLYVLESMSADLGSARNEQFVLNLFKKERDRKTLKFLVKHLDIASQRMAQG